MRLTVVGCAGSFPGPDSAASCYILEAEGFRLVIDLGNGALGPLQKFIGLFGIDAICLSHLHADHCVDLYSYSIARTYSPAGLQPSLPVYGPAGTCERIGLLHGPGARSPGSRDAAVMADAVVRERAKGCAAREPRDYAQSWPSSWASASSRVPE